MEDIALLIIDMQVGNFSEPNPIYKGNELLARINSLVTKARAAKIATVYVQNNGGRGDPDEYGTPGWEIHPPLKPTKRDVVVQKQTPDAFHETNLQHELESRGIRKLIIAGLQTEYCIDTTCRRAFSLGFKVTLIKDSHSTWNSPLFTADQIIEHHNNIMGGWFVTLKNEKEIEF
jgi:nicotinamidase-related amidase